MPKFFEKLTAFEMKVKNIEKSTFSEDEYNSINLFRFFSKVAKGKITKEHILETLKIHAGKKNQLQLAKNQMMSEIYNDHYDNI